jgi:hypothetical protein
MRGSPWEDPDDRSSLAMGVEPGSTILLNIGLKSVYFELNCALSEKEVVGDAALVSGVRP